MNKFPMSYAEFLDTVKVLKMLYGRNTAEKYFTDNIQVFYDLDNVSLIKSEKEG